MVVNRALLILTLSAAALLYLCPRTAAAQPARTLRLEYVRLAGAQRCPGEAGFRDAVVAQLGYDPFTPQASQALAVVLSRSGHKLQATVSLRDSRGKALGSRVLSARPEACADLVANMGLTISMVVDRVQFPAAAPLPPSPSSRPAPPREPIVRAAAQGDWSAERVRGRLGFSTAVAMATTSQPGLALALQVGIGKALFSGYVEVVTELPALKQQDRAGGAKAYAFTGSAIPCVRPRWWFVCARVSAGVLFLGAASIDTRPSDRTPFAGGGGRAGVAIGLTPHVSLEAYGDVGARLMLAASEPAARATGLLGAGFTAQF